MSTQRHLSISLAIGQAFLQEKCQQWMQARFQGLQRAMFWGWQQAAAQPETRGGQSRSSCYRRGVGARGSIPTSEAAGREPRDGRLGGLLQLERQARLETWHPGNRGMKETPAWSQNH